LSLQRKQSKKKTISDVVVYGCYGYYGCYGSSWLLRLFMVATALHGCYGSSWLLCLSIAVVITLPQQGTWLKKLMIKSI
ncbi:uncharacterized protein B0P05DRAFT_539840, partial [Gilbertella persicaria]|uniref:uncharacterized protein n=1 Tax=Gilbertella persicaria TaxID=101096 RepID=UPI00221F8EA4